MNMRNILRTVQPLEYLNRENISFMSSVMPQAGVGSTEVVFPFYLSRLRIIVWSSRESLKVSTGVPL